MKFQKFLITILIVVCSAVFSFAQNFKGIIYDELQQPIIILDDAIVTAQKLKENAAASYDLIQKQAIAKNNLGQDLPYLLNQIPATVITSDAGTGIGYTGIRIRGTDASRTNVTINGIPLNDAESQGTFLVNLPDLASSIDNIQVQRGVGSSINGAGAFGASINIQTEHNIDSAGFELASGSELELQVGHFW